MVLLGRQITVAGVDSAPEQLGELEDELDSWNALRPLLAGAAKLPARRIAHTHPSHLSHLSHLSHARPKPEGAAPSSSPNVMHA